MNKEELEKEAKVFATYYENLFPDEFETFYKAFLKVAEPREKRIENLEKGNEELKEKLEHRNCVDCSNHGSNIKLIKAKAIIKNILQTLKNDDFDLYLGRIKDAEQFLKEMKEDV